MKQRIQTGRYNSAFEAIADSWRNGGIISLFDGGEITEVTETYL